MIRYSIHSSPRSPPRFYLQFHSHTTPYTLTDMSITIHKLETSSDWPEWFADVQQAAESLEVWEYVDPSTPNHPLRPTTVEYPSRMMPPPSPIPASGPSTRAAAAAAAPVPNPYYDLEFRRASRQEDRNATVTKNLAALNIAITGSLGPLYLAYRDKRHPRNVVVALQAILAESRSVINKRLSARFDKLSEGTKVKDFEKWLLAWPPLLNDAVENEHPEITKTAVIEAITDTLEDQFPGHYAVIIGANYTELAQVVSYLMRHIVMKSDPTSSESSPPSSRHSPTVT
jgi:hypothetical protein